MSIFNAKEDAAAAKPLIDALVSEAEAAGSRLIAQAGVEIRKALNGVQITVSAPPDSAGSADSAGKPGSAS